MCEEVMVDFSRTAPEKKLIGLRYFNPIGAHESGLIGEDPQGIPNNLMPIVARVAAGILPQVSVFGRDYDTDDGTELRDYIHVVDLAKGHLAAIEHAEPGIAVFNLGTGRPTSVLELIDAFEVASGRPIPTVDAPRRPGDAQATYRLPDKAQEQLGWRAEFDTARACATTGAGRRETPPDTGPTGVETGPTRRCGTTHSASRGPSRSSRTRPPRRLAAAPPGLVLAVPVDRRGQSAREIGVARSPPEFGAQLRRIDGVSPVVPGSVGDEHERVARLAEQFQDGLDDRSVGRLAVGADQMVSPMRPRSMIAHTASL